MWSYSVFIYHLSDSIDFDGVAKMEEKGFAEYAGNCVSLSGKFSLNFPIDRFPYWSVAAEMWLTFLYQVILFKTWQTRFWSKKIVKHSRFGRSDAILSTISTFQRTLMILLSILRRISFNRVQSSIFVSLLWEDISLLSWFSSAGKMKFISLQVVVIKWTDKSHDVLKYVFIVHRGVR